MSNNNEVMEKYKNIQKIREITRKTSGTSSHNKIGNNDSIFENISRYVNNIENSNNIANPSKYVAIQKQDEFLTLSQFRVPDDEEFDCDEGKSSPILEKKNPESFNSVDSAHFQGFTTASNKKIEISNDALKKIEGIFNNIENETEIGKSFKKPFQGFSTASNKKIEISDNALNKAKGIFNNIGTEDNVNNSKLPEKSFQGFSTGSNKKIEVSEKAIKKAKGIFNSIESDDKLNNQSPEKLIQGFSTASNKKIEVSEKALKKVKGIFDNIENNKTTTDDTVGKNSDYPSFQGFSTASNKKIEVSDKALEKVKGIFDNVENNKTTTIDDTIKENNHSGFSSFQGFSTASNKKIEISNDALHKAKEVFKNIKSESKINEQDVFKKPFQGFSTANNKKIEISTKALNKVKEIFCDIQNDETNSEIKNNTFQEADEKPNDFQGFTTASNKKIKISEKALVTSKKLFENLNENKSDLIEDFIKDEDVHIFNDVLCEEEMMNTEVFKEFENEVIENDTKNNFETEISLTQEISGSTSAILLDETNNSITNPTSPILTPKINIKRGKKKFLAPFKKDKKIKLSPDDCEQPSKKPKLCEETPTMLKSNLSDLISSIKLDCDYSKKLITLKNLYDELKPNIKIPEEVLDLNPDNCLNFVFTQKRQNFIHFESNLNANDLEVIFLKCEGIDKNLIPNGWINNHLKWIIWKLGSYERQFGETCHEILNVKNVLQQLKSRYDKELFKAQRPILRKIIETDDIPGRRMILCVSKICFPVENSNKNIELEVTDGWYSMKAKLDECLCKAVKSGKIKIGTKLLMYGAELINCQQGKSPLEDIGDTRLLIHGNSCRRVKPWMRLGLWSDKCAGPPRFSLLKSHYQGGHLPIVTFLAVKVYPSLFIERQDTGDRITRSEKLELRHCSKIEMENQIKIEQIYNQVEKEYSDQQTNSLREVISESDGFHLPICMDTQDYAASLSATQKNSLSSLLEKKRLDLKEQIDSKVKSLMEEKGISKKRKVVEVAKVRGLISENGELHTVLLTIWAPSHEIKNMLKENKIINLLNVTPTGRRYNEIHLSAGKKTILCDVPDSKKTKFTGWEKHKRQCNLIREMQSPTFTPVGNEVDTVGLVVHVEPSLETKINNSKVQTLYLADENHFMIAVNFWCGIEKYGYENVVKEGCILACANLQHRARTSRKRLRYLYATEISTFSQNPKKEHLDDAFRNLKNTFSNMDTKEFIEKCKEKLNLINPKPKTLLHEESGLEYLDFDSTFVDSTKSFEESFLESNVEKRLKKLEMYGEPPPLIPVQLNVSADLKKDFVLPLSKC